MKICLPIGHDKDQELKLSAHFGSAPAFYLYDTISLEGELIDNGNLAHEHGTCNPVTALGAHQVDAVVCQGMGARAIGKLHELGIKVYRTTGETAGLAITEFQKGQMEQLTIEDACHDHQCR